MQKRVASERSMCTSAHLSRGIGRSRTPHEATRRPSRRSSDSGVNPDYPGAGCRCVRACGPRPAHGARRSRTVGTSTSGPPTRSWPRKCSGCRASVPPRWRIGARRTVGGGGESPSPTPGATSSVCCAAKLSAPTLTAPRPLTLRGLEPSPSGGLGMGAGDVVLGDVVRVEVLPAHDRSARLEDPRDGDVEALTGGLRHAVR
jgi:hypothetical protein